MFEILNRDYWGIRKFRHINAADLKQENYNLLLYVDLVVVVIYVQYV